MTHNLNSIFRCEGDLKDQRGTATLTAVLILALLGVFTAAAMSRVTVGQAIMNNDLGNSKSFYAAQASLEQMTHNFDSIFTYHLYPTSTDISAVQNAIPSIPGYNFTQAVTAMPTPSPATVIITSGPYGGLSALKDSWKLDATATAWNSTEVHLTREFNNFKIPIFQFGIFYNRDLAIHPGPVMWFSGRVHSNANLFVMSGGGITFTNRVTASGEVIRDWNRNGVAAPGNWNGPVTIQDPSGTPHLLPLSSGGTYFGSVMPGGGTGWLPGNPLNPDPGMAPNNNSTYSQWNGASDSGMFGGNLQAHVPLLQLPLQIGPGRDPIELIKRAISGNDYQAKVLGQPADDNITYLSRYCDKPNIRVSLTDSQAELPGGTGGVRLDGASDGLGGDMNTDGSRGYLPQAMTDGYQATRINGFRLFGGTNYPDNGNAGNGSGISANRQTWIKVEIVNVDSNQNVITTDITKDFLSLGMTALAPDLVDASGNPIGDSRAILKLQRYEIPGGPVRVADVNVADNDGSINVMTTAQQAGPPPGVTLPTFTGLTPTTANYIFSPPGSGQYLAVGPFNVFTYQPASGSVGNFSYVSMTNNNYTPSMAGDPTNAANVNGYSVLTNLHQKPDGTLNYFSNINLTFTLGNNNTWISPLPYGTTTALPVSVSGFTSPPALPAGYSLSTSVVPPSFQVSVVVGTSGPTFKLTFGGKTTGPLACSTTLASQATAAQVQAALTGLSSIGAGNCIVTGPTGAGMTANPYVYTVYFSNPSLATTVLTGQELNASGAPTGTVTFAYSPGSLAPASIEGTALGRTARINAASARTETVVPFPIEIFNPREGIYSGDMTFDPTLATTNPNWYALYANGTADKAKNAGTVPTWAGSDLPAVGVMSVIDVDVANLKSFLMGAAVTNPGIWDGKFANGLASTQIPTNPGWILYISDRRGDRDFDGEYDMEDIYGPIDGILQPAEDANLNGKLDVDIQGTLTPNPFGFPSNSAGSEAAAYTAGVPTDIAAFFDHQYFRRGVRVINGTQLPGDEFDGFTLATENPAYVLGNYNATGITALPSGGVPTQYNQYIPFWVDTPSPPTNSPAGATTTQVPASIAADGVWLLSVNWLDASSFRWPMNAGNRTIQSPSMETYVRTALLTGSTSGSILAKPNQGGGDACLDGGVHNFPRFLEQWNTRLDYCGSLINPFYSRQAIGAHKTGGSVYGAPQRNWTFDADFLDIRKCPPGTPLFQFIQRTGFRETVAQER
jgi:hypothetical protein